MKTNYLGNKIRVTICDAIRELADVGTQYTMIVNDSVTQLDFDLVWDESNTQPKPTNEQVIAKFQEMCAEYELADHVRKRQAEYPPITDYLDGVVKGDQAQIDKYIADCQAVKAKYPKGS